MTDISEKNQGCYHRAYTAMCDAIITMDDTHGKEKSTGQEFMDKLGELEQEQIKNLVSSNVMFLENFKKLGIFKELCENLKI